MPITEADVPDLLPRKAAAEFLGVSTDTIDRLVARRAIDVVRIGNGRGQVRISKRALLDYLNRQVVPADRPRRERARKTA